MAYQHCSTHICASEDLPLDHSENESDKNKLSVDRSNMKALTEEQLKRSYFLLLTSLRSC